MSWDKLEIEAWHENWNKRNDVINGKKGNDSMNLQKMSIEELKGLQVGIADEIKIREQMEIEKVTNEFLAVWKKMEKMGVKVKTEEIITMSGDGKKAKDLQIEINGKLVEIYQ